MVTDTTMQEIVNRWLGSVVVWALDSRLPVGALHLAFPSRVGKSSTSLLAGVKVGRIHLCRVAGNTV